MSKSTVAPDDLHKMLQIGRTLLQRRFHFLRAMQEVAVKASTGTFAFYANCLAARSGAEPCTIKSQQIAFQLD